MDINQTFIDVILISINNCSKVHTKVMKAQEQTKRPPNVQAQKLIGQVVHRFKNVISDKESIFYALAIGFTQDPLKEADFKYTSDVYQDFMAFPLVGTAAHRTDFVNALWKNPNMPKFNPNIIRHAEQRYIMVKDHVDLSLEYEHETLVTDVIDKGKNTIVWFQVRSYVQHEGKKQLAFLNQVGLFLMGLGGFGFKGKNKYPPALQLPKRQPELTMVAETFPNQAFYYRLTGDRNPLHTDLKIAAEQKLERPIIHGMATYGTVARVFVQNVLKNDPSRLKSYYTRFTGHVYPGEAMNVSLWKEGENRYIFEAETVNRKTKVLIGEFQLRPEAKL